MIIGHHLMCVWPVTGHDHNRDALIEAALPEVERIAAAHGARVTGPSTWRLIDTDDLEGWEHHDGPILVATMPAEPVALAVAA